MPDALMFGLALVGATLLGLVVGWVLGARQGRNELSAYQQGVRDGADQNQCWVKTQLPNP